MSVCHQCGASSNDDDRFCRKCGAAIQDGSGAKDPLVGRNIAGAYVVQELVGVGGMGRVYRAEQRTLGRTVAIKVVHPHLLSDEQSVARFYTEAKAASRLNHPNSVSIIDFGRTDDGVLYLVMEFLTGKDLARLMLDDGPLPFARIADILCNVLDALAEAHALDVVHRDLKPENVIIERMRSGGDLIKVVDFGLAKLMTGGKAATKVTLPGLVCGTPDYMSPEQGRGEDVDARGDLYSVGVMLFELLTETLPYVADTPTNVVLKHIQDPIPDPREIAPQRGVPGTLADICMRALAKSPVDRFQSAAEMAEALQRVAQRLQPTLESVPCPGCARPSAPESRFCAHCGSPMRPSELAVRATTMRVPMSSERSLPARWQRRSERAGVLIARDAELTRLMEYRDWASGHLVPVVITGEAGVGRTRLVAALAERCAEAGDRVAAGAPHPTGAPVPYNPIRDLVLSLFELDWAGLERLVADDLPRDPMVAAGLIELVRPEGLRGANGLSRAGAVAAALAHGVRQALQRGGATRCLLVVDDTHRSDGLTQQVLAALGEHCHGVSVLLVMVSQSNRDWTLPADTQVVELRGLTLKEAESMMADEPSRSSREPDPDDRLLLPLYIEQLAELGLDLGSQRATLPPRLADAVSQRLQRLGSGARLLLQCVAILGVRVPRRFVETLCATDIDSNLTTLIERGFLFEHGATLEVCHPFVRELVEASIPAAARKELHARALEIVTEAGAPLEVRAHHAFGSGEALGALVLLERLGDLAFARGDLSTAVLGYRRSLELARRELLESGDTYLEGAIESVSQRLGRVLSRRGDLAGAEGVLREALEYSAPSSNHRAQIMVALAAVLADKERVREAYRFLGQALEIAIQVDSASMQVDVQMAVAKLRRREGNLKGALAALSAAWDLMPSGDPDRIKRAKLAVRLATVQVELGEDVDARPSLEIAERTCREAEVPFLMAQVKGLWGKLEQREGHGEQAALCYGEAAEQAALAGDARLSRRFRALSGVREVAR